MTTGKILVDKWMEARSIRTLSEAAKALGKSGSGTISNWRSGYAKPDDESIALMCEQCGEDPAQWIGKLHLEFEDSPRLRKVWLRLAQSAAAAIILYAFSRLNGHQDGALAVLIAAPDIYIMRTFYPCPRGMGRVEVSGEIGEYGEPPRLSRRLHPLRGLSNEKVIEVFT